MQRTAENEKKGPKGGEEMEILVNRIWCLSIGVVLDLILGDPQGWPHPVRLMGKLCGSLEKRLLKETDTGERKRRFGFLLVVLMLAICGGVTCIGLIIVYHMHRAAVETVAENTSDGVIAPLLYLTLGGAVLGVVYKTINTMDSMIGYKSEKYLDFGRYAAGLDDAANFLPSRLAACLMLVGTILCKLTCRKEERKNTLLYNVGQGIRMYRRDRLQHASPNSAQTEAVCAGALGLRLAGDAWYFGSRVEKPYIGDALRPVEAADIRRANRLLYAASFLMWLCCMGAMTGALLWLKS